MYSPWGTVCCTRRFVPAASAQASFVSHRDLPCCTDNPKSVGLGSRDRAENYARSELPYLGKCTNLQRKEWPAIAGRPTTWNRRRRKWDTCTPSRRTQARHALEIDPRSGQSGHRRGYRAGAAPAMDAVPLRRASNGPRDAGDWQCGLQVLFSGTRSILLAIRLWIRHLYLLVGMKAQ